MYQVKINGQNFDRIPTSIQDVSISRFIKFRALDLNNSLGILYWALDCQPEFKHTPEVEDQLANVFQLIQPVIDEIYRFMKSQDKHQLPASIDVLGYEVKLKKGLLNDLPYWPYVVTKNIIMQERVKDNFDPTDRIPEILAHYLYSEVTKGKYDERKANEFVEVINDLPMTDCIQLGNFFFAETDRLVSVEQKEFIGEVEENIKEAGIEIFQKYGDINNMETLSMGDVSRWNDIKSVDRGTVYVKLAMNRDKNTFEKALKEILNRESKRANR